MLPNLFILIKLVQELHAFHPDLLYASNTRFCLFVLSCQYFQNVIRVVLPEGENSQLVLNVRSEIQEVLTQVIQQDIVLKHRCNDQHVPLLPIEHVVELGFQQVLEREGDRFLV